MYQKILYCFILLLLSPFSFADTYLLPLPGNDLIGKIQYAFLKPSEDIKQLAHRTDIGYYEILQANPTINPDKTYSWQKFTIPSAYLLPNTEKKGIVVNIAELRLYYYPENSNTVITYPVAIGMHGTGTGTPTGQFTIIEKLDHPRWYVPKSILVEMQKEAVYLPTVMEPGPENPLGEYGLRLNARTYLFHGTNIPPTVGRRASAGCMHLYPKDIKALYDNVSERTPVTIVDEPFKVGWVNGTLYFQAVQPLYEDREMWSGNYKAIYKKVIQDALQDTNQPVNVDWKKVSEMVKEATGIPEPIGHIV